MKQIRVLTILCLCAWQTHAGAQNNAVSNVPANSNTSLNSNIPPSNKPALNSNNSLNVSKSLDNMLNTPTNDEALGGNLVNTKANKNAFNNAFNNANTARPRANVAPPSNAPPSMPTNSSANAMRNAAPPPLNSGAASASSVPPIQNVISSSNAVAVYPSSKSSGAASSYGEATGARVRYSDAEIKAYETSVGESLKQKLKRDLDVYCLDYCTILNLNVEAEEVFDTNNTNLGFEESSASTARRFRLISSDSEILIDSRFGTENIDSLKNLFAKLVPKYEAPLALMWSKVIFPETAQTQKSEAEVRAEFASRVRHQIERIITDFCPTECKLNSLDVRVVRASMDEVERGSVERYLFARDGKGALFVRGVQVNMSMNSAMNPTRKEQITSIIREYLLAFGTVTLDFNSIVFPRSASDMQKDVDDERKDPYGVEKIGALLRLFKENLVSKEVIKETNSIQNATNNKEMESKESRETRERSNSQESSQKTSDNSKESSNNKTSDNTNLMIVIGVVLALVLLVMLALWLRSSLYGNRMKAVIANAQNEDNAKYGHQPSSNSEIKSEKAYLPEMSLRQKLESDLLKEELIENFVSNPKAAREVFSRLLKEDGIDFIAKYVAIFGEIVIYELLKDLQYKGDLNILADYIHKNAPKVEEKEATELLRKLKLQLVASRMRVLTNKVTDAFDFLKLLSPRQVFELIRTESVQIQGVILSQLASTVRGQVFAFFKDNAKILLLQELPNISLVPREYLRGTADSLRHKVQQNPIFNAEIVQGTQILIDLIATASFEEQRTIINELDMSNPESAMDVRKYLISADTLMFMPESMLTDFCLEIDLDILTKFLLGTKPHIRNSIFAKVSREITANWRDAMQSQATINMEAYKRAEIAILEKIKELADNGTISLAEINAKVYPPPASQMPDSESTRSTRDKNRVA